MQDSQRFRLIFLAFLGRQHARLSHQRFFDLQAAAAAWNQGPAPEFFERLPEFNPWREKPVDWWQRGIGELEREAERGRRFILRGEGLYPAALERIADPPHVLSLVGDPEALISPHLAVVGAREPVESSLQWMDEHLSEFLAQLPIGIASGGARGVDQAAHRVALRRGRPTVVFLPSGLGALYPGDLRDWLLPVCENGGAFVSEFHPRTPMRKWNFQSRNRLIAGIGEVCLVIEARVQSGTALTAKLALEAGRAVGCLPASPWQTSFSGNLELLENGAVLIRNAQDLVTFLARERPRGNRLKLGIEVDSASLH